MIYQSIVIITPRLCAILSINIFYTLLVLSTDQEQTFVLTFSFHGILFWRLRARYDTFRPTPAWIERYLASHNHVETGVMDLALHVNM